MQEKSLLWPHILFKNNRHSASLRENHHTRPPLAPGRCDLSLRRSYACVPRSSPMLNKTSENRPEFREPCLRDHLSITTTFSCTVGWSLKAGFTVITFDTGSHTWMPIAIGQPVKESTAKHHSPHKKRPRKIQLSLLTTSARVRWEECHFVPLALQVTPLAYQSTSHMSNPGFDLRQQVALLCIRQSCIIKWENITLSASVPLFTRPQLVKKHDSNNTTGHFKEQLQRPPFLSDKLLSIKFDGPSVKVWGRAEDNQTDSKQTNKQKTTTKTKRTASFMCHRLRHNWCRLTVMPLVTRSIRKVHDQLESRPGGETVVNFTCTINFKTIHYAASNSWTPAQMTTHRLRFRYPLFYWQFLAVCLIMFMFEFRPRTFTTKLLKRRSLQEQIEALVSECSCPFV